jgi:ABC-type antimicrobial peptide transport system permease subunit
MIILQATFFVLPSILMAALLIVPILYMIGSSMGIKHFPIVPTTKAIIYAVLLGVFIPIFSSIIPIRKAQT